MLRMCLEKFEGGPVEKRDLRWHIWHMMLVTGQMLEVSYSLVPPAFYKEFIHPTHDPRSFPQNVLQKCVLKTECDSAVQLHVTGGLIQPLPGGVSSRKQAQLAEPSLMWQTEPSAEDSSWKDSSPVAFPLWKLQLPSMQNWLLHCLWTSRLQRTQEL